jgi:nucleolar protein 56
MLLILQEEHPTAKYGEALRNQVEERLNFFDSGVPPSKGADGLRKVFEELELEEEGSDDDENMDVDGGPALTTLEAEPSKKDKKDKKKEKKDKKRKVDDMEVDEDEEDGEPSVKKVKLSKEEKKALKKAKKEKKEKKEKEAAEVYLFF